MGAGFLADHLAHGGVVVLIGDVAVAVHDLLHQIGGVQIAAVDAGGLGRDQGQRRDVEVLAEGVAGQVQLGEVLGAGENAGGLAVQVHAGAVHQAEVVHVFIELLVAQLQAEGDEGGVAGVGRRLLQGLGAVGAGAVDGGVGHVDTAGAGVGGVHIDEPLLHGGGHGEDLEGGAGLVGIVQGLVAPLLEQLVGGVGEVLLEQVVLNGEGVVDIVGGIGHHAQDAAGFHVHDDAGGAVFRAVFVSHLAHIFLQIILDVGVQGQDQVLAVFGGEILLILIGQGIAPLVLGGDHQAGLALEVLVVAGFQAIQAGVVGAHKAQNVGGQGAVGVHPLGVGHHVNAVDIGVVDELADLVRHVLVHLLGQDLILGVRAVHAGADGVLGHAQNPGETGSQGIIGPVDLGFLGQGRFPLRQGGILLTDLRQALLLGVQLLLQVLGGQEHRLRGHGHRQLAAVAVVDGAAEGGDHRLAGLLVQGPGLHLLVPGDLEVVQLEKQDHEQQDAHDQHQPEGAAADGAGGLPGIKFR